MTGREFAPPTVETVDQCIAELREKYPEAIDRPDFLTGMLLGLVLTNTGIVNTLETEHRLHEFARRALRSVSVNLGENYNTYSAVRDVLHPDASLPWVEGGEVPS